MLSHFQRAHFLDNSSSVHFYRVAGNAKVRPLWDSVEGGLFLHVQIEQALWNKNCWARNYYPTTSQTKKISSLATHRLLALWGWTNVFVLLCFSEVRHTHVALRRKTSLSHWLSRIWSCSTHTETACSAWGIFFLHSYSKCTSLLWLIVLGIIQNMK